MTKIVYDKHSYACEVLNIDVYFQLNNSLVFSTEKTIESGAIKCREIVVLTECKIESYNSITETNRYSRGQILTIQGILSFFTGVPLTVYNNYKSSTRLTPIQYPLGETHLIIENVDFTADLIKLLERITEEPQLIITLLDRWRKAVYLKCESYDADLYYDEASLNFFHILELFGEYYAKEFKSILEKKIENMMEKHFQLLYFNETQVEQMTQQNRKAVTSILIGSNLNLSSKIKYFLEKHELLDDNVSFFIDNMIKIRNAIAHGRITYQTKFIWPLSPFFNLSKDSYENIEFLFILTATMISKYVGMNCWEDEWEATKTFLLPSKDILESFIDDTLIIEDLNSNMLLNGNKYNLTLRTIFNHYIKNPKKQFLKKIEKKIKKYFLEMIINEENAPDIFNISLIFADSEDLTLKNKAIENIKITIKNKWYGWSNFKDTYSYLDFYNVNIKWYKEFLDSESYMKLLK